MPMEKALSYIDILGKAKRRRSRPDDSKPEPVTRIATRRRSQGQNNVDAKS